MFRERIILGAMKIWNRLTRRKCKYHNVCRLYNPNNRTCTHDGGKYYSMSGYAGCYRALEYRRGKRGK